MTALQRAEQCRYCQRVKDWPCRSTREMKVADDHLCYKTMLALGGGEYTVDQQAARNAISWIRIIVGMAALIVGGHYYGMWTRDSCLGGNAFACGQAAFFRTVSVDEYRKVMAQPEWECRPYPGHCDIDTDWHPAKRH